RCGQVHGRFHQVRPGRPAARACAIMKLTHTLTDAQSLALTQLFPQVLVQGENALNRAVEMLIEQEQQRRGAVDGKTGASPVAALRQGSFLKLEYDAGLHVG